MAELSMRRNVYSRGDFGFGGFQSPTGSMSAPGGGTLSGILNLASSVLGPILSRTGSSGGMAQPFLGSIAAPVGRALLPALGVGAGAGIMNLLGSGGGGELFGTTAEHVRPLRNVPVQGPDGRMYWFGYLGKPVLYSGDLAAARRVQRVASRASRARGSRRTRRFRR